jgi:O-antigen ligase
MITGLIIFGLALFSILAVLRRDWGIYLIIFLLPTYQIRFDLGPIPLTFLEGMVLILGGVEILDLIRQKRLLSATRQLLDQSRLQTGLILLFLAAALISVFVSPVPVKAAGIFKAYFFEPVLFYFLILLIINTQQKLHKIWQSIGLLISYLSVFGIYQFFTLANLPFTWWAVGIASRRITSLVNHPNALALLMGPFLALLILLPKSKLAWFALGTGAIAFYLSFSRAGWLALLASVIAIGFFTQYRKQTMLGAAAVIILVLLVPFSRVKLLELAHGNAPTQENRYVLWSSAFDILRKSPVFGAGILGFHELYKNYPLGPDQVIQNYPHDFFLNFWLETGLLGLAAMLALLWLYYKKIRKLMQTEKFRWAALAMAAAMGVILLHGLVDVPYFKNDLSIQFWLIYALPNLVFLRT